MNYDFTANPSILIQGAMDTETEYLIRQLEDEREVSLGNWKFHTGFLGVHKEPVIISKTYQGMVNAAAATSLALVYFKPAAVISQGIGGGHSKEFHRGDIVIGEKVVPMGAVRRMYAPEGAGIDERAFEPLQIEIYNCRKERTEKVLDFPCDANLLAIAEKVGAERVGAEKAGAERVGAEKVGAEKVGAGTGIGRGVLGSADEWNNQIDRIALLKERYHTAEEDMESAAPAQLCLSYGIPFIGIRILSNSIVHGEEFDESVGIEGQKYVLAYVEALHGLLGKEEVE